MNLATSLTFVSLQPQWQIMPLCDSYVRSLLMIYMVYGNLICAKRLLSYRQNKEGCLQTLGGHQNMIIKYLSGGQWS